jgi:competence protein ComEC
VSDSQATQLEVAAASVPVKIDVFQVPHHGSITGLSERVIQLLQPKLAVNSVGKNTYGHPSKYALQLLEKVHVPTHMTIKEGDTEIITDGKEVSFR